MKSSKSKSTRITKRIAWLFGGILLAIFIAWSSTYLLSKLKVVNYAEEVALPLEAALMKAGATRSGCLINGDSGRGYVNKTPWFQAFYEMPMSKEDATKYVYDATAKEGYKLKQATKDNRGPVNVDDAFVEAWHYDHTSKQVPYSDLNSGTIELAMIVDGPGSTYDCERRPIKVGHSIVGIDVKLTEFKD